MLLAAPRRGCRRANGPRCRRSADIRPGRDSRRREPLERRSAVRLRGARPASGSVTAASGQNSRRGSALGAAPTAAPAAALAISSIARPPFVLLADVRLDDADRFIDRQRVVRHRRGGSSHRKAVAPRISTSGQPSAVKFEPHRAAEQHDQRRQAVGADRASDRDQRRRRQRHADRVPAKPVNMRRAQPFGDRPGPPAPAPARGGCRARTRQAKPGRERRIDGEVERQQHHRDPAEPGRHRRLIGEGGRDPVEADDELAEAEQPADQQRAAQRPARSSSSHRTAKATASAATSRPARTRRPTQAGDEGEERELHGH